MLGQRKITKVTPPVLFCVWLITYL